MSCFFTYIVRLSCRLCLTLAILSARYVGTDLVVVNNSEEFCFKDQKTTSSLIKQLQTRIVEFVVLHLLLQIHLESFTPSRRHFTDSPDMCAGQM